MDNNFEVVGSFPPVCAKHGTQMTLAFYDRPGSAPGNGWFCSACQAERLVTDQKFETAPPMHPHEKRFFEILSEWGELHRKKGSDYGNGEDPFANVLASSEWGIEPWLGVLLRIGDKFIRLKSLVRKGKLENESAIDSMRDIGTYMAMCQVLYEEFLATQPKTYDYSLGNAPPFVEGFSAPYVPHSESLHNA